MTELTVKDYTREERISIAEEYFIAFGVRIPCPMNVDRNWVTQVAEKAVRKGRPIPENYSFYSWLPKGAVT